MFMNKAEMDRVVVIIASMAGGNIEDKPTDTPVAELFEGAIMGAFGLIVPDVPHLGAAITATIAWLMGRDRTVEARSLELEGKMLFALANDTSRVIAIAEEGAAFREAHGIDALTAIGIKPIWDRVCGEHGRDPITGRAK
jgi:hypothetical protein